MKTTIKKPAAKARSKAPAVPLVSAAVRVLAVLDQLSRQRAIGLAKKRASRKPASLLPAARASSTPCGVSPR